MLPCSVCKCTHPASSGGRCCTHARVDTCASESMFGACVCMRACEHAQACTVQCLVTTRGRVCTCGCLRAAVCVCVCVCVCARARAYTHNTGACMALSMPRRSFWMAASVTAGGEGPGGECGCREVRVPHDGAGCPGRPGLGVLPAHSWSAFPTPSSAAHSLYLCFCPVCAPRASD